MGDMFDSSDPPLGWYLLVDESTSPVTPIMVLHIHSHGEDDHPYPLAQTLLGDYWRLGKADSRKFKAKRGKNVSYFLPINWIAGHTIIKPVTEEHITLVARCRLGLAE